MNIDKKDIVWSYISQIFQMGAALFILPIILRKLSPDEVGIWYIFTAISSLINLLDFGLQPTLARNISYIFSGAQELSSEGIEILKTDKVNYKLLKNFIYSVKNIYRTISIAIILLSYTFGIMYINSVIKNSNLNQKYIIYSWIIYVLSIAFNFYYYYYTPLLLGRGLIKESHKTIVYSKIFYVFFSYIGLLMGYGLLGIAVANLLSSFINRISSYIYFYDKDIKDKIFKEKIIKSEERIILKSIWKNSYRLGLVSIGAFLINKSSILIMSKFLSLDIVGKYGISMQVVGLLATVSSVFFNTYVPMINYLRIKNDNIKIKEIFSKALFINYSLYFSGYIFLIFFGDICLKLLKADITLLNNLDLTLISLILFLEMNHSIAATMITTKNIVPFLKPALLSGVGIVILTLLSLKYTKLGVTGIILSQGFIQLVYNNWKWPYEVSKDLNSNYFNFIRTGFLEIKNILFRSCKKCKKI